MAAQFFSSLADNALLVAAIQMLRDLESPAWMTPSLKQCFVISYVLLAPLVGAFADSMPKGRVMLITNGIKIVGCSLMLFAVHPLARLRGRRIRRRRVFAGQVRHPHRAAAGAATRRSPTAGSRARRSASIILGVLLGGVLISGPVSSALLAIDIPRNRHRHQHAARGGDRGASWVPTRSPRCSTGSSRTPASTIASPSKNPLYLIREFAHCNALLWRDKLGQISLATTTLFWGAGATLQFIVIDWAATHLCYNLSHASYLQGVVAVGIALGAVARGALCLAARRGQGAAARHRDGRRRHGDDLRARSSRRRSC